MVDQPIVIKRQADVPVDDDAGKAYTMPAKYYLDADVFEQEKDNVFYREWHYVTHLSKLSKPGDFVSLKIADESIFIMRSADGKLRGFYNVCRHRAHRLLEGSGNVDVIVCPYHAWSYHTDGKLRFARYGDVVSNFNKDEFCLNQVKVDAICGLVFVNLDLDAMSLNEKYNGLEDDIKQRIPWVTQCEPLRSIHFGDSRIAANWKVVVDNFLECYHCAKAHPAFSDLVDLNAYKQDTFDFWSRQSGPKTRYENSAYDFTQNDAVQGANFWYVWPTTTINVLPGDAGFTVLSIFPDSLDKTEFVGDLFFSKDKIASFQSGDIDDRTRYLTDVLGPEDQSLCESVQQGLRSRSYNQGRFMVDPQRSGIAEHAVHHFHKIYLDSMKV